MTTRVLVTGGTGVLGRALVARLAGQADVKVLSRHPTGQPSDHTSDHAADRPAFVQGNLETGDGLAAAVSGVDVIAHCASAADYRRPRRDVEQTRRLLDAARAGNPHIVYISIVGVDRIPFGYYRAKLECERLIEASGLPWTVLRTTQFHELALMFLQLMTKSPVAIVPRGVGLQPVDVGEVADRMAGLVLGEPAGRVPDMGGPPIEDSADTLRTYLALTGRRRAIVRAPLPGKVMAAFRAGHHMVTDGGTHGVRTFEDFLREQIGPDGAATMPYDLKGRLRRGA